MEADYLSAQRCREIIARDSGPEKQNDEEESGRCQCLSGSRLAAWPSGLFVLVTFNGLNSEAVRNGSDYRGAKQTTQDV